MSDKELHGMSDDVSYNDLNAELNIFGPEGEIQFGKDKEAVRQYFLQHVNQKTQFFHNLQEKLDYLLDYNYYEEETLAMYDFEFVKERFKQAYGYKFRFDSFIGAYKYYTSYTLKSFDGNVYLERYEDRVVMNGLYLAQGNRELATAIIDEIMNGRYQPATPTFLNAGKAQRGELVSCFLLRTEDNLESISRNVNSSLQLSKRGGGVALNLTNLREQGAPIKGYEGASSGVVPVMKILEDSFSYANQLGARQGAGAVYLHAHHPDILRFLDTKRENADEKVRIKTLSLGVTIPNVTYELAKQNADMYLFSPYDVEKQYGVAFSEMDITAMYEELVNNPKIKKTKIRARDFFTQIAEMQFESGYPYILNVDNANENNPIHGRVTMSNLCTEILQVSTPSTYKEDLSYDHVGEDISCNLGSMNIAKVFDSPDFEKTIEVAIRALTSVSDLSNISSVPSIEKGNSQSHAVGLGVMNLHGFFMREGLAYGSPESLDLTDKIFQSIRFYALKASNKLAKERGVSFGDFDKSTYASGEWFNEFIDSDHSQSETQTVKDLLAKTSMKIPTQADWKQLKEDVMRDGLYNRYLLAVAPTGSISYINNSTSSIHPVAARLEIRKEGKLGRVYNPAPFWTQENTNQYLDAYEIGPEKIIDVYAAAGKWVDQGLSLTLFYTDKDTTRTLNKRYIYAWRKGIKSLYYARVRSASLTETDTVDCISCMV